MKRKGIILFLILALVILIVFVVVYRKAEAPGQQSAQNDETVTWNVYTSEKYGFKISYPDSWQVAVDEKIPGVHIYKKGAEKPDTLTHHNNFTNISIYPEGIGTEGVRAPTASSSVTFITPVQSAFDLLLADGRRFASFASFKKVPASWKSWGFVWARTEAQDLKTVCIRGGKEMPVEQCDIGLESVNDEIMWRGSINESDWKTEQEILKSFTFTSDS